MDNREQRILSRGNGMCKGVSRNGISSVLCQGLEDNVRGEFIKDASVSGLGRVQFQDHLNSKSEASNVPLIFVSIRVAVC